MVFCLLKLLWLAMLSLISVFVECAAAAESPSLLTAVELLLQFHRFRLVLLDVFFAASLCMTFTLP